MDRLKIEEQSGGLKRKRVLLSRVVARASSESQGKNWVEYLTKQGFGPERFLVCWPMTEQQAWLLCKGAVLVVRRYVHGNRNNNERAA